MSDPVPRTILHVDMDAFYASVEIRDDPDLHDLPVVVGGSPDGRGVVAAASYAARQFGIHSAMPAATARRLCPEIVFIRPRHEYYAKVSRQIRAILEHYTPLIEPLSLDEAFLDVSGSGKLHGDGVTIARKIKSEIRTELKLVASVGVAPNKFLAKLASDLEKPDGLVVVHEQSVQRFLDPLPVTRIWGVGKSGARALHKLGITRIDQLRQYDRDLLRQQFGDWGEHIWRLAHGTDERSVVTDHIAKSISHETTFAEDIKDRKRLHSVLTELLEQVMWRLRRQKKLAQTLQLKLRYEDFTTITRSHTLPQASDITSEFAAAAANLLNGALAGKAFAIRLLGVGVSSLGGERGQQADLFQESDKIHERHLDGVADQINNRYGKGTIRRGRSIR